MNQYEECPECGNKQLIIEVEEVSRPRYSAKTGKLISKGHCFHTNCCQYTVVVVGLVSRQNIMRVFQK